MIRFLDRLRAKPEGERKAAAFTAAATITGIIFIVWLTILFSGTTLFVEENSREDTATGTDSFRIFQDEIADLFEDAKEQFEEALPQVDGEETVMDDQGDEEKIEEDSF